MSRGGLIVVRYRDENRIAGSVLGAVAGGVIGHQFGGGHGTQRAATVVGAQGGGWAQATRSVARW